MLIDAAALSHIGRKKAKNEDSFGIFDTTHPGLRLFQQGMLIAVADGLGGHVGGDIASKLAISMMKDVLKEGPVPEEDRASEREDAFYLAAIEKAMLRANDSIFQTNKDLVKGNLPMGTTLCTALLRPRLAYLGNVGDSRGYLFRNGAFAAKTEDHSWVDEQVKQGLMTQAAAEKDNRRNLVTRCIGTHETLEIDTYQWPLRPDDQVLICTDGLTNMLSDTDIAEILQRPLTVKEKVDVLVDAANKKGGKDNITLILAWIDPDPKVLRALRTKSWLRKRESKIRTTVLLTVFGLFCFLAGYFACFFGTR